MTEADDVRTQAQEVAEKAREAILALRQARLAIEDMQRGILLLDLTTNNMHVRSVARLGPSVGQEISSDSEALLMIETEMKLWINKL